jgi:uncharacterized membrane protein YhaH (DUF805 family)
MMVSESAPACGCANIPVSNHSIADKGMIESAVHYPQAFWKWGGRLTRIQYFCAILLAVMPIALFALIVALQEGFHYKVPMAIWNLFLVAEALWAFSLHIWAAIRRFHDMGYSANILVPGMIILTLTGIGPLFILWLLS